MSSFGGLAWVDFEPDTEVDDVLERLRTAEPRGDLDSLFAGVERAPGFVRIQLSSWSVGYADLAELCANLMSADKRVTRVFVAFDHDEYGAEVLALAPEGGRAGLLYHVYVHFGEEDTGELIIEGEPVELPGVPALVPAEASDNPGHVLVGAEARQRLAGLYGVRPEEIEAAEQESDRSACGVEDYRPWMAVLGLEWARFPEDRSFTLRRAA
jgi:hypothetical protein